MLVQGHCPSSGTVVDTSGAVVEISGAFVVVADVVLPEDVVGFVPISCNHVLFSPSFMIATVVLLLIQFLLIIIMGTFE